MSYVGNPYNFVPLGTKVYRKTEITKHNELTGLSGYLEYQVAAQTPIIVDGGDGHFYKNKDGKAAIPGSTMRGLVRSNMQILSQSSVVDDIANEQFMYRCVGGSKRDPNQEVYDAALKGESRNALGNVVAAYLSCKNGQYYLIPAKGKKLNEKKLGKRNYYILSERKVIESQFKEFTGLKQILQHTDTSHFEKEKDKDGNLHYIGEKNKAYVPCSKEVYYKTKGLDEVIAISLEPKQNYRKGTLLLTGFIPEKKAFYVIPEMETVSNMEQYRIRGKELEGIDAFKRDFQKKQNQLTAAAGADLDELSEAEKAELEEKVNHFFDLPGEGECKPVFYIEEGKRLCIGVTPHLRLLYEKTIYDGLPREQRDHSLDYCKAMFGFSKKEESYRSRLAFQEAILDGAGTEMNQESRILAEPKPSSYLDYLVGGDGCSPAAYRGNFSLRGMKQYWLHRTVVPQTAGNNGEVVSSFYPYPQGSSFTGQIRFTNLSEEELGMLLWSLLLEEGSQQNLGKGKPYGFGRVSISLKKLEILDYVALYGGNTLCLEPYKSRKAQYGEYIAKAKAEMTAFLGSDVMAYAPIRDFLLMKDEKQMPEESKIRYMRLGDLKTNQSSEYQERKKNAVMLDTIAVVLGKEKRKASSVPEEKNSGNGGYRGQKKTGNGKNKNRNDQKKSGHGNSGSVEYSSGGSSGTLMGSLFQNLKIN